MYRLRPEDEAGLTGLPKLSAAGLGATIDRLLEALVIFPSPAERELFARAAHAALTARLAAQVDANGSPCPDEAPGFEYLWRDPLDGRDLIAEPFPPESEDNSGQVDETGQRPPPRQGAAAPKSAKQGDSDAPGGQAGAGGSGSPDDDDPNLPDDEKKRRERFRANNKQRMELRLHDDGLGDRMLMACLRGRRGKGQDVRFCRALASDNAGKSGWLFYDDGWWRLDDDGEVSRFARVCCERIESVEMEQERGDARLALLAFAVQAKSMKARDAMLKAAHTAAALQTNVAQLDKDPYLLNLRNGTLDLCSGELLPHRPEDLLTKQLPIDYTPDADCPVWRDFLLFAAGCPTAEEAEALSDGQLEAAMDEVSLVYDFYSRAVGYTLSGDTSLQCWFILQGEGHNGKSTFLDVLRALAGDPASLVSRQARARRSGAAQEAYRPPPSSFCCGIQREFLIRGSGNQSADRERMLYEARGARLAVAAEMNRGDVLDEAFVKQLTGGETVVARRLYQQPFSYHPQFKLWLGTNYFPTVKAGGLATFRRVVPIPWERVVPPEMRDYGLLDKLLDELPGILAWAARGFKDFWQRLHSEDAALKADPLGLPPPVLAARKRYQKDSDWMAQFVEETLELEDSQGLPLPRHELVMADALFKRYEEWAESNGIRRPLGKITFAQEMRDPPYRLKDDKVAGGMAWIGVRLKYSVPDSGQGRLA